MATNLDLVREQKSQALGNVTDSSTFTGDGSGSFKDGMTIVGIRSRTIVDSVPKIEQAYVYNVAPANNFSLQRVVLFDKLLATDAGEIAGSWDTGLSIKKILNIPVASPGSFTESGQVLAFDGVDFLEPTQAFIRTQSYVTAATHQAVKYEEITANSTANAIVITPVANPTNGDNFTVWFSKADAATPVSNTVTVNSTPPFVFTALGAARFTRVDTEWIAQNIGSPGP